MPDTSSHQGPPPDGWGSGDEPTVPYGTPPPRHAAPPPPYAESQRHQGPPWGHGTPPPPPRQRNGWLVGGIAAFVVALVGAGGAVILATSGSEKDLLTPPATTTPSETEVPSSAPSSTAPIPTGSFSDGLTTGKPTATPAEKQRTQPDVDRGVHVHDDVYVQVAQGWVRHRRVKSAISFTSRKGGFVVEAATIGVHSSRAVSVVATEFAKASEMVGIKKGAVQALRPANSNIANQATVSFAGRVRASGVTVSLVGRCTTFTGVESVHNVTVTACVLVPKSDPDPGLRDARKMLASIARSI